MCVWWRLVLRRRERRRRRRRIESCCMDILVVRVFSFHAVVMPPWSWSSSSSSSSCEANGSLRLSSIHYKVMSSLFRHGLSLSLSLVGLSLFKRPSLPSHSRRYHTYIYTTTTTTTTFKVYNNSSSRDKHTQTHTHIHHKTRTKELFVHSFRQQREERRERGHTQEKRREEKKRTSAGECSAALPIFLSSGKTGAWEREREASNNYLT